MRAACHRCRWRRERPWRADARRRAWLPGRAGSQEVGVGRIARRRALRKCGRVEERSGGNRRVRVAVRRSSLRQLRRRRLSRVLVSCVDDTPVCLDSKRRCGMHCLRVRRSRVRMCLSRLHVLVDEGRRSATVDRRRQRRCAGNDDGNSASCAHVSSCVRSPSSSRSSSCIVVLSSSRIRLRSLAARKRLVPVWRQQRASSTCRERAPCVVRRVLLCAVWVRVRRVPARVCVAHLSRRHHARAECSGSSEWMQAQKRDRGCARVCRPERRPFLPGLSHRN